jgi:C-terminal processing protease CtpA/Prc
MSVRRETRSGVRVAVRVCLCLLAIDVCAQAALSKHDRDVMRSMLRQVHADLAKHYFDPAFHGINLDARFRDAQRRLQTAPTLNDAVATLSEFVLQLDDSHTAFIPPNRRFRVDYGWQMAMVGDVPLVTAVAAGSDAAAKGLAPGDRVLLLNAFEPTRRNLGRLAYFYRFVAPQRQQRVGMLKPDGTARTVDVVSRVIDKPINDLGDLLIELEETLDRARDRFATVDEGRILVWKMAVFGSPEAVKEAIDKARGHRALVLDLRANGGGAVAALKELVGGCFDREVLVATETQRGKSVRESAKPSRGGFSGGLVVLVDSQSASAAEMFARIVQLEKRGRLVGDRTAGAVMTARVFPHQIEGLTYATTITVGDVRMSDGASLEKTGVEPDEIVLPTPADLAAGRDPALAEAIATAGGAMTPSDAGRLFK